MNITEVTALLGRIQVLDNRQVDELTIEGWAPIMAPVAYRDAVEAINWHFANSRDYLMPKHIVDRVRAVRNEAHERAQIEAPRRGVPRPPRFAEAVKAAQDAAHAAGVEDTRRAAYEAARAVLEES